MTEGDPPDARKNTHEAGGEGLPESSIDRVDALLSEAIAGGPISENLPPSLAFVEQCLRQAGEGFSTPTDAEPEPPLAGRRLGGFTIVRKLGSGGMGVVFEAVQESLGRKVAIKVLPPAASLSGQRKRRFEREAEAIARLENDSIVKVFALEAIDDYSLLVMERVPGCSLSEFVRRERARCVSSRERHPTSPASVAASPVPAGTPGWDSLEYPRWIAARAVEIAEALETVHREGIIHRDVKPGNILLASAQRWKITDFGVAQVTWDRTLSGSGPHPGTLIYSSPEQSERTEEELDARTDIYSLGATLYECLTLHAPIEGHTSSQILDRIQHGVRLPIRKHNPRVPREFASIVGKALETDRERRYATAGDLASDIKRFLAGEPVTAVPAGPVRRAIKWVRRRPATATAAVSVAGLAVVAGLWAASAFLRERAERPVREQLGQTVADLLPVGPFVNWTNRFQGLDWASKAGRDLAPGATAKAELIDWNMDLGVDPETLRDEIARVPSANPSRHSLDVHFACYEGLRPPPAARSGEEGAELRLYREIQPRLAGSSRFVPWPAGFATPQWEMPLAHRNTVLVRGSARDSDESSLSKTFLVSVRCEPGRDPSVCVMPLGREPDCASSVPLSSLFPAETFKKSWSSASLVSLPALSTDSPVIALIGKPEAADPDRHISILFLAVERAAGRASLRLVQEIHDVEGDVDPRAVEIVDPGEGVGPFLLVGALHPTRKAWVYALRGFPEARPELIGTLPLSRREGDIRSLRVHSRPSGREERVTLYVGLGMPAGLGLEIFEGTVSREGIARAAPSIDPSGVWDLNFYGFGFVEDVLVADMDGREGDEIVVAKRWTEGASGVLGKGFPSGVPDGLYVYHRDGPRIVPAFGTAECPTARLSRDFLPTWKNATIRSYFPHLARADLNGDGRDEILASTHIEIGAQHRDVLRVGCFDPAVGGLAKPLRIHLSQGPGFATAPWVVLADDLDGSKGAELIVVGADGVRIMGESIR